MSTKKCPCGKSDMHVETRSKNTCVNGVDVCVESQSYVCPCCGIEAGTPLQASAAQKAISDAYRKKIGLLTGEEIMTLRQGKGLSRDQLADLLGVCVDSVRRWESGLVQDYRIDRSLRRILL